MNTLQFTPKGSKLSLTKLPLPEIIEKTDVIVQVAYAGICGTDLHIFENTFPCSENPVVLGHEFSGVVTQVGPAVTHVKIGDRVAVDPQSWCTTCIDCTSGRYHCCQFNAPTGIFRDGGWAEYAKVDSRQVYKLPDSISLKQGALCEPLSCVSWGWDRLGEVAVGQEIVIMGAGIIGNLWASLFHHKGHRKVILVEPQTGRRQLSQRLGTGYECLTPNELENKFKLGCRADVVVDCSGNPRAIEQAFAILRPGGKLCVFGVANPQARISISPYDIFKRELTIIGAIINPFSFPKAIGLIDAMGDRYFDFNKLGISEYTMEEKENALATLKKGEISKAMFCVNISLDK